jgi:vacuolar-type H+-ATPase subunit I/STV1
MTDKNDVDPNLEDKDPDVQDKDNKDPDDNKATKKDAPDVEALVEERLKDIKKKLDKVYEERDAKAKRLEELEALERERERAKLKAEGKIKEAYEAELNELREKNKVLEENVTKLTRDTALRDVLSDLPFRTTKAKELAFKEISGDLVKDETGKWVHKTGVSIEDFVKSFAEDDSNSFLFVVKGNSGGGSTKGKSGDNSDPSTKSLFDLSQAEVLKRAAEGKLRKT